MSLRAVCDDYLRTGTTPIRVGQVAAIEKSQRKLAQAIARSPGERPPSENFDQTAARIDAAIARGHALERRDLKIAPWCLWTGATPLADKPGRIAAVLERVREAGRRRVHGTLATAHLRFFTTETRATSEVGAFLAAEIDVLGAPWVEAQRRLALFDPTEGPRRVSERAFELGVSPDEVLVEAGLRDVEGMIGFRRHLFAEALARLAEATPAEAEAHLDAVRRLAFDEAGDVRFDGLRAAAVDALVLPFSAKAPPRPIRDVYLDAVLRLLGDPRSDGSRWSGSARAETIVRRWLTEVTLRQFFDVVDAIAPDPHWRYRRAFWSALNEKDHVDEAWVVLEQKGADTTAKMFGDDVAFGRFAERAPTLPGQAALILRIGTLIAVEWSHTTPCAIWDCEREEGAPELGLAVYDPSVLKKKEPAPGTAAARVKSIFKHVDPPNYIWQQEVASHLRVKRGIDFSLADYVLDW